MYDNKRGSDYSTELPYFIKLWDERAAAGSRQTAATWDERAAEWIVEMDESGTDSALSQRVEAMAGYLRKRGLLSEDDRILDVGCGLGSFAIEFAKTSGHVLGIDFSSRFIEHGNSLVMQHGITNVSFEEHDLLTLDVDSSGFSGAFDLVFASISPAVTAKGCLQKLMKMSKGKCCNVSYLSSNDSLLSCIIRDVYGGNARPRRDGMGFYALLNLLLLSGYYPETHYFTVEASKPATPSQKLANDLAFNLRLDSAEDTEKILRYLEKKGETVRHTVTRFGSLLWDTRLSSLL